MHGMDPRFRGRRQPDVFKKLPLLRDLTDLRFDEDVDVGDELTQVRRRSLLPQPTLVAGHVALFSWEVGAVLPNTGRSLWGAARVHFGGS